MLPVFQIIIYLSAAAWLLGNFLLGGTDIEILYQLHTCFSGFKFAFSAFYIAIAHQNNDFSAL